MQPHRRLYRGFFTYLAFKVNPRFGFLLFLSLVGMTATAVPLLLPFWVEDLNRDPGTSIALICALASMVVSLVAILLSLRNEYKLADDTFTYCENEELRSKMARVDDIVLEKPDAASGFKVVGFQGGGAIVRSAAVDQLISVTPAPAVRLCKERGWERHVIRAHRYVLPVVLDLLRKKFKEDKLLYNERKIALLSNLRTDGLAVENPSVVQVGKTSYFTSLLTNEASRYTFSTSDHTFDVRSLSPLGRAGSHVAPLSASPLSNHIGISCLCLTRDNRVVVWTQMDQAQQSEGKFVATGSGSANWGDLAFRRNFWKVVEKGMRREMSEENSMGWLGQFRTKVKVVGFFRDLNRGGKPEFIGLGRVDRPYRRLLADRQEVVELKIENNQAYYSMEISSKEDLLAFIDMHLKQEEKVSTPLLAIFLRLKEIMANVDEQYLLDFFIHGDLDAPDR